MTLKLSDPSLLRQQCYVDGAWIDADGGGTVEVANPAHVSEALAHGIHQHAGRRARHGERALPRRIARLRVRERRDVQRGRPSRVERA